MQPVAAAVLALPSLNAADRDLVGRWGERLCYEHLAQQQTATASPMRRLVWLNESAESGLPYDITSTDSCGEVTFIEVKASTGHDKPFINVSLNEMEFARRNAAAYHIYRVCGAGSKDVTISCLADPVSYVSSSGPGSLALMLA